MADIITALVWTAVVRDEKKNIAENNFPLHA